MDILQFHSGVCECAELVYLPDILSVHTHQHRRESELLVLSIQRYVPNRNLLAASPHLTCSLLPPRSCLQIVRYILSPPPPTPSLFIFLICLSFPSYPIQVIKECIGRSPTTSCRRSVLRIRRTRGD